MKIEDKGIVIKIIETLNDAYIVSVLTKDHGIIKGYFKRSRNAKYLISIGCMVQISFYSRIDQNLGYLKLDVERNIPANLMLDPSRMCIVDSMCSLINYAIPINHREMAIYEEMQHLIFQKEPILYPSWVICHIAIEMYLLKISGFGFNFNECYINGINHEVEFISPNTGNSVCKIVGEPFKKRLFAIPKIMKDIYFKKNMDYSIDIEDVKKCYEILLFFLQKNIFNGNKSKMHPKRLNILKYVKV
ncbi:hypothetical protein GUI12_01520 [Anaplasmataceae bacterium AB001_6]|nr:hypothetical protein GUI12_01520 [Anaplasmataceae bacterium AB001_6]